MSECEDCSDVVEQYPLLALAVSVGVGTVVYAALSLAIRNAFNPVETAVFALIFGILYVAVSRYVAPVGELVS